MRISLHPEAVEELEQAVIYYEDCQPGLGKQLSQEIDASIKLILAFPHAWSVLEDGTRRNMLDTKKYFSFHRLLPLYNPRALPQQSVVTSTNISDIESWLDSITPVHQKYLTKIDIPISERKKVMTELTKMGITSASLFPGIEGTCKALKEKYF